MNKIYIVLLLIAHSAISFAQADLIITDSTWNKEVFPFPLNFAADIPFIGIEEAYFPKHWVDTNSIENWSYVFVWDIQFDTKLTAQLLEDNLQLYFNGLMGYENTIAVFMEQEDKGDSATFKGKIKTIDAFFTKKPMTLHVLVERHYCPVRQKTLIMFRFSPKGFEHEIWQKLNAVALRKPVCGP
jgi:hypothetical protein